MKGQNKTELNRIYCGISKKIKDMPVLRPYFKAQWCYMASTPTSMQYLWEINTLMLS